MLQSMQHRMTVSISHTGVSASCVATYPCTWRSRRHVIQHACSVFEAELCSLIRVRPKPRHSGTSLVLGVLACHNFPLMSPLRIVLLSVCLLLVAVAGVASSVTSMQMVTDVNRHQPSQARESTYWWTLAKRRRVVAEYRRLYPDGPLRQRLFVAQLVAGCGVIGAAICLGFGS